MKSAIDESPGEKPTLPWKTILAPTDYSEPSIQALKTAACLAEQSGAKITLLHVIHLPVSGGIEAALNVDEIVNVSRQSMDETARAIPPALLREKLVRLGTRGTVQGIIEAARELSADLIVIATHGHSRLERILLGSTAERVVLHAPCPVLVVRRKEMVSEPNQTEKNRP
ncbi:MAG TPA: universal stress protein [Candidatus Paceibacterota bacterium]|nr:universal stress protein [Candidatus Paceibacterota bacterium]